MEEYDFQNIFKLIGLEDFDNPEYLKTKITEVAAKIRNNMSTENRKREMELRFNILDCQKELEEKISEYESLGKSSDEIENLRKQYDEKIQKITDDADSFHSSVKNMLQQIDTYVKNLIACNDVFQLLYHYLVLESFSVNDSNRSGSVNFGKKLTDEQKEHKKLVNHARKKFKGPEFVEKYVYEKIYPLEHMDVANRDMSRYAANLKENASVYERDFIYNADMNEKPVKIMDTINLNGDDLKVYEIGTFAFGRYITIDKETNKMRATSTFGGYKIISVVRIDENENKKIDSGIICLSEDVKEDQTFYANVVFSELAMKNANENNFGFIGKVDIDENNERKLYYERLETQDLVRALAYAQKCPERPYGKTLSKLIEKANKKLLEDKLPNYDEGGR